jgi:photosynthetic reaction center cytochrome c subunit
VLAVIVVCGYAIATYAHGHEEEHPARATNLQVLPKDLPGPTLGKVMKRYEQDLGVTCSHCHVEDSTTGRLDYASDENPAKQTARIMIAMLNDINERHLAQLGGDARYAVPVTCGSCHRGRTSPPPFEAGSR